MRDRDNDRRRFDRERDARDEELRSRYDYGRMRSDREEWEEREGGRGRVYGGGQSYSGGGGRNEDEIASRRDRGQRYGDRYDRGIEYRTPRGLGGGLERDRQGDEYGGWSYGDARDRGEEPGLETRYGRSNYGEYAARGYGEGGGSGYNQGRRGGYGEGEEYARRDNRRDRDEWELNRREGYRGEFGRSRFGEGTSRGGSQGGYGRERQRGEETYDRLREGERKREEGYGGRRSSNDYEEGLYYYGTRGSYGAYPGNYQHRDERDRRGDRSRDEREQRGLWERGREKDRW